MSFGGSFQAAEPRGCVSYREQFDPKVDDALKAEFMDELHVMRCVRTVVPPRCYRECPPTFIATWRSFCSSNDRSLSHPNIVAFKGACTRPPRLCFVMELCGPSIFSILHGGGKRKPNLPQRVQWARQIAEAMAYLHGKSPAVIHRDLKSHNVLIGREGSAKLCDFGLVRQRTTNAGTPNYMAPELLQSKPFSRKVDVFAFGMLLHEILTGKLPFHGWRPATIVDEVPKGARPDVPENEDVFPRELQALVRRCWDTDPNERPEFAEIVRILQNWKPRRSAIVSATAKLGGGDALDSLLGK